MPPSPLHIQLAQEIERNTGRLARSAAQRFTAAIPDADERYGPFSTNSWTVHYGQRLDELAAALRLDEPDLFHAELRWSLTAFEARTASLDDLQSSLDHLRDTLVVEVPAHLRETAAQWTDRRISTIDDGMVAAPPLGDTSTERLALEYLEALLEGDRQRASHLVLRAVEDGLSIREAYEGVLLRAQQQVGALWHRNEVIVAQEHFVTQTTISLMSILSARGPKPDTNGCTVLLGSVAGNPHDLGARAVGDFLERDGWNVVFFGGNMPRSEIVLGVEVFGPDLLALSASLSVHLSDLALTIRAVRELDPSVRILVGGRIFSHFPELAPKLGADAAAGDIDETLQVSAALVGLSTDA